MKICKHCEKLKSYDEFNKRPKAADRYDYICKSCQSVYRKKYYNENREKQKEYTKIYNKLHRKKLTFRSRLYRKRNREKVLQWKKAARERRKHNPSDRLKHNMGCSIRQTLKAKKRNRHWEDILGYSITDLMSHIEQQFKDGMSWNNYGKWHIDHIKPQSLFTFIDDKDSQFKECWALSNLQPLWAKDNLKKWKHFNQ